MEKRIVRTYKDLFVWQRAHFLVLEIYKVTRNFPKEELYALVSQLRRAVISVPANIVEGHARGSRKEFINFLNIAKGSLAEVDYFLYLSLDLKYLSEAEYNFLEGIRNEVGILLYKFSESLKLVR